MKKIELALGAIAITAILMHLFMIPFGSILLILTLSTMALLYIPYGFFGANNLLEKDLGDKDTFNGVTVLRSIGGAGLGLSISVIIIGIQFKLMFWPGADSMLYIGIFPLGIIFTVALVRYFTGSTRSYFFIFSRIIIFGSIGLFLVILPKDAIFEFKYRNYPDYIEAVKQKNADPKNEVLRKKVEEERRKIN